MSRYVNTVDPSDLAMSGRVRAYSVSIAGDKLHSMSGTNGSIAKGAGDWVRKRLEALPLGFDIERAENQDITTISFVEDADLFAVLAGLARDGAQGALAALHQLARRDGQTPEGFLAPGWKP